MPELAALHQQHQEAGLVVIGVNIDDADDQPKAIDLVAKRRLPFTIWLDPKMLASDALSVKRLPTTLVVDREGTIVWRREGAVRAGEKGLQQAIRSSLAKPSVE